MAKQVFPWHRTFVLGFGFFGISIIIWLFSALFMALTVLLMSRVQAKGPVEAVA